MKGRTVTNFGNTTIQEIKDAVVNHSHYLQNAG